MATLKVTVHEARDLPVMDRASGLADPYAVLRLDDMEHTTEIARRTLNPVWNRDYRFDAPDLLVLQEDPLEVRVYDHDIISRDDLIGMVWVDCNIFIYRRTPVVVGWFPLVDTIEGMRGEIRLTIRVKFHGADNPMRPQIPERIVRRLEPQTFAPNGPSPRGNGGAGVHETADRDDALAGKKASRKKASAAVPHHSRAGGLHGHVPSTSSFHAGGAGTPLDVNSVQQFLHRFNSSGALFEQNSFSHPAFGSSVGNLPGLLEHSGGETEMSSPLPAASGAMFASMPSPQSPSSLLPFFCESDPAPIPAVRAQQPNLAGEEESVLMFSVWRLDPAILRVERVASMVEELIVKADPEHSRLTNLRSSRSTHEARVTQLFKLSGKVRRQLSRKVVELQCNAVLGYSEAFDIEASSIIVRAYGTPCVVSAVRYVEETVPRPLHQAASSQLSLWNSFVIPQSQPQASLPPMPAVTGSVAHSRTGSHQPSTSGGTGAPYTPLTPGGIPDAEGRHLADLLLPPSATTTATEPASSPRNENGGLCALPETLSLPRNSPRAPTEIPMDSAHNSRTSPPFALPQDTSSLPPCADGGSSSSASPTLTAAQLHRAEASNALLPLLSRVPTPSSTNNNSFAEAFNTHAQAPAGTHDHMRVLPLYAAHMLAGDLAAGPTGPSVASRTTAPPTAAQSELDFLTAAAAVGFHGSLTASRSMSPADTPRLTATSRPGLAATQPPQTPLPGSLPLGQSTAALPVNNNNNTHNADGKASTAGPPPPAMAPSRSAVLILTVKDLPSDVVQHIGGHICSRSVKIVSKLKSKQIISQERDAWWMELREELRANARSFHCNAILGYEEETQYLEDVVLLSLYGTAVMVDLTLPSLRAGPDLIYRRAREKVDARRSCALLHLYHGSQHRAAMTTEVGDMLHHSMCNVCHRKPVPDVLLASCTLPVDLSCEGPPRLVHVAVSRQKQHDTKGVVLATIVSQSLPFIEYSLHKQLLFQLRLMGLNACFGMRVSIVLGPDAIVGTLTGTGCRLVGLPTPASPRLEILDPAIAHSETVLRLKDVIIKRSLAKAWRKRQRHRRHQRELRDRRHRTGGDDGGSSSCSSRTLSSSSSRLNAADDNNHARRRSQTSARLAAVAKRGGHGGSSSRRPPRSVTASHTGTRSNSAKTSHAPSVASSRASSVPSSRGRGASADGSRSFRGPSNSSTRSSSASSGGSRTRSSSRHSDSTWMRSPTDSSSSDELPYRPVQEALNSRIVDYVVKVDDEEEADLMLGMADETTFEDSILLTIPYVADSATIFDWQERIIMHRRYSLVSTALGATPQGTSTGAPIFVGGASGAAAAAGGRGDLGRGDAVGAGGGSNNVSGGAGEFPYARFTRLPRFTSRALNDCCADAKRAFAQTVCRLAMRHDARPERLRVFDFGIATFFEPHSGDLHLRLEGTLMLSSAAGRMHLVKLEDRAFRVCLQSAVLADPLLSERASSAMASPVVGGSAPVTGTWDVASISSYNNMASSLPSTTTPVLVWANGTAVATTTTTVDGAAAASEHKGSLTASGSHDCPVAGGVAGLASLGPSFSSPLMPVASASASRPIPGSSSAPPHAPPLSSGTASFALTGLSRSSPEYLIYHFYRHLFAARMAPFSLPYTIDPRQIAPLRVWAGGGAGEAASEAGDWAGARVAEEEDRRTYTDYRDNMSMRANAVSRHVQSFLSAAGNSLRSLAERTRRHLGRTSSSGGGSRQRFPRPTSTTGTVTAPLSSSRDGAGSTGSFTAGEHRSTTTDARLSLGPSDVVSGSALAAAMDTGLHQPARRLPRDLRTLAERLPPVVVTPVDYVAGRAIVRYVGRLSHHFIREAYAAGSTPGGNASAYGADGFPTSAQSPLGAFFQRTEMELECCVESLVRLAGGNALLKHRVTVHEVSDSDGSGSAFLFATVTGDIVQVADLAAVSWSPAPVSPLTSLTPTPTTATASGTTVPTTNHTARMATSAKADKAGSTRKARRQPDVVAHGELGSAEGDGDGTEASSTVDDSDVVRVNSSAV